MTTATAGAGHVTTTRSMIRRSRSQTAARHRVLINSNLCSPDYVALKRETTCEQVINLDLLSGYDYWVAWERRGRGWSRVYSGRSSSFHRTRLAERTTEVNVVCSR